MILRTEDGGKTWESLKNNLLPEIHRLYFQQRLGGWALGGSSSVNKSGVLTTSNGGVSWSSQTVEPSKNFIDGDLVPSGFVVVDDQYRLGKISGRQFESSVIIGDQPTRIHAVRMLDAKRGWAVGDEGAILTTRDGGLSWTAIEFTANQLKQLRQFDFATLCVSGNRVFVAGNPGNYVFSFSIKNNKALRATQTGTQVAIRKLNFGTPDHGWAVGGMGTIISTNDTGQTWEVVHRSRERVAILAASQKLAELPLAFLSRYSGDDRFVSGCVLAGVDDHFRRSLAVAALNRVGCSCLIDHGKPATDGKERELEQLVRAIRTQQPNVLVCSSVGSGADSFVAKCRNAIELAADENAFTDQVIHAGLAAWTVDRFVVRTRQGGNFTLRAERFLPTAGILLQDQIAIARALAGLNPIYRSTEHYRVESFTGSISAIGDDIMYGLETLGKQLPRRDGETQRGSLGSFATSPLKLEKLAKILELSKDPLNRNSVKTMIQGFGSGQNPREQGIWLWQLAEEFQLAGQSDLAATTLDHLSARFHHHPLAPAAMIWLTSHYSSSEVEVAVSDAIRNSLAQVDPSVQHASKIETSVDEFGITQLKWEKNPDRISDITQAEYIDKAVENIRQNRIQKAGAFFNRLKQRDPVLALSESVRFMEAKLTQKINGRIAADSLLKVIRRNGDVSSPVRFAASRELRLDEKAFVESLPICFKAKSRPLLDGQLDDVVWQDAVVHGQARMKVVTPNKLDSPTNTDISWLAYDDQFIYFAARCSLQSTHQGKPLDGVRTRDPDLSLHDRIRLEFDFDRDLQSSFSFEVDSSGRAAESCAGSTGWNPTWYVASSQQANVWTIELAIPLKELIGDDSIAGNLIAYRTSRLDGDSIDLWSQRENRAPEIQPAGIVAGLKIEPKRYEFLRFAEATPDPQANVELP